MLSFTGGLVLMVALLVVSTLLIRLGINFSEALYLSMLGLTFISYGVTEWYLHRGK
jgi:TctA family transporter